MKIKILEKLFNRNKLDPKIKMLDKILKRKEPNTRITVWLHSISNKRTKKEAKVLVNKIIKEAESLGLEVYFKDFYSGFYEVKINNGEIEVNVGFETPEEEE